MSVEVLHESREAAQVVRRAMGLDLCPSFDSRFEILRAKFATIDSTSCELKRRAVDGIDIDGAVIVADTQTAGMPPGASAGDGSDPAEAGMIEGIMVVREPDNQV